MACASAQTVPARRRPRGLQAERTALAWNRTGLAVVANALLVLRAGLESGHASLVVVASALMVGAGVAVLYGAWRRRSLLAPTGAIAPHPVAMTAAAVIACVACAAGVASVLTHSSMPWSP